MTNATTTTANEILRQLGNAALVMLGAHAIIATENGVQFKFQGSRKANVVRIDLTADDLYDIEISKYAPLKFSAKTGEMTGGTNKVVASGRGLFCGDLGGFIHDATGLDVHI